MRLPARKVLVFAGLAAAIQVATCRLFADEAAAPPATAVTSPEPARGLRILTPEQLDALLRSSGWAAADTGADEQFARRLSFDLIGRQPTLAEQQAFAHDTPPQKHRALVERLLASQEFGTNWANYWCDTIAFRVPPPELTYLNYQPLKGWLAERLNKNTPWHEVVRELLTATGKIDERPAATFVGYHLASATNLAAETSRIFLGQQIGCAECHDHPFDHWKRLQFHELAAFFARTRAKASQNDGGGTVVSAVDKGAYLMPDMNDPRKKGTAIEPAFLDETKYAGGADDTARRAQLAQWVASRENPWFAKAYANRVWARLMGRGFYEPVDDLGESRTRLWPALHDALAEHFAATNFDVKDLFRLIASTEAYRRGPRAAGSETSDAAGAAQLARLRGDEVFAALAAGIDLPNVTPAKVAPTDAIRFPPPAKSTRDLVHEAFGTDPSLAPADAPRTMAQALWMMNNAQLQAQINASPDSGTMLARLLVEQRDDRLACQQLFARVLARPACDAELRIALEHVSKVGDRGAAFEDLLWGLVNSAEFTTRH